MGYGVYELFNLQETPGGWEMTFEEAKKTHSILIRTLVFHNLNTINLAGAVHGPNKYKDFRIETVLDYDYRFFDQKVSNLPVHLEFSRWGDSILNCIETDLANCSLYMLDNYPVSFEDYNSRNHEEMAFEHLRYLICKYRLEVGE